MSRPTADQIKAWRTARAMTQTALATALGIPARTVIAWENDQTRPPPYLGLALAALDAGLTPDLPLTAA
ncbi:helix-turn-helix domain-containing protein [Rhizobium sp. CRIBSB]|nr:helix-turn-helix domain-containing protein [Rhizobium sp. CRIBSB]